MVASLMYHLADTMRYFSVLLIVTLVVIFGFGADAAGQTCPAGQTTSITGTVYAPNGTDPLPNVTVYIPNGPVDPFTPGVSCPVVGTPPSGSSGVGATTNVDGTFELDNVPVAANIPLVIVSGRWRRQLVIPGTVACQNTALPRTFAVMPQNHTQGEIPKIAIATGAVDQVECVLRKMGINDSEFTNPSGSGRINLYLGSGAPGSAIDASTPTQASLMENATTLNSYDVLMLPCQGTPNGNVLPGALGTQELGNFRAFADGGGRVYSSHYSYAWMYQNPPFDSVVNWAVNNGTFPDGVATVDTSFTAGLTLSQWLDLPDIKASTSPGQMQINTLKHDLLGVVAPTQSWLTLNNGTANDPHPVMQFVFDTPIAAPGSGVNQCGRVLFNEYHVEDGRSSPANSFPTECNSTPMTAQEKLLEYMLFELTDDGGQPSLDPTSKDFGSQALGFTSPVQTFTWKNNSSFASQVKSATPTGDFAVVSNNCSAVAPGTSCQIGVVFTPTALGSRTGTLTVVSSGNQLIAKLMGTGTPGFTLTGSPLSFGNLDVTATASQTLTLTSLATGPLPVPTLVTTGPYSVSTAACGTTLAALAHCTVTVTFQPTATGLQAGTVGVSSTSLLYNGLAATLSGNGIDFTLALNPASGTVVAGDGTTTTAALTPLAGFAAPVSVSCVVAAAATASACTLATTSGVPPAAIVVSLNTTSQFKVVGFGGLGGPGYLWLTALFTGWLIFATRRRAGTLLRSGLMVVLLVAISLSMTGCTGKLPAQNAAYTKPGNYAVTVRATDGFLIRTSTYSLTVTAK